MMIGAPKHDEALVHAGFRCAKFKTYDYKVRSSEEKAI